MGNSSSASNKKSAVRAESKEENVPMTAQDTARGEKLLKHLENSDKYWENLASSWNNVNADGEISKKTFIESMRGMVSQSSGYSTLLEEMKEPIAKSAVAYEHFEELLNDEWMIKKHNDKVKKARLIYQEYWSLLLETSTTVNKILVESKRAINAIDEYDMEIEYQKIPDNSTIDKCLDRLKSWNSSCASLNELKSRFGTLGALVNEQRHEWKKMEEDRKNKFKKSFKSAALFFGGIIAVAAVGAALAFTGGTAAVAIGAAYFTWIELAAIIGVGSVLGGIEVYIGSKMWTQWKQWKKCHEARQRCDNISTSIKTVQNYFNKVVAGVITVQSDLGDMMEKVNIIYGKYEDVKGKKEKLQKKMEMTSPNQKYIEQIVKNITKDFSAIKTDLLELNKACIECINHVKKCQQDIVDAVNGK